MVTAFIIVLLTVIVCAGIVTLQRNDARRDVDSLRKLLQDATREVGKAQEQAYEDMVVMEKALQLAQQAEGRLQEQADRIAGLLAEVQEADEEADGMVFVVQTLRDRYVKDCGPIPQDLIPLLSQFD